MRTLFIRPHILRSRLLLLLHQSLPGLDIVEQPAGVTLPLPGLHNKFPRFKFTPVLHYQVVSGLTRSSVDRVKDGPTVPRMACRVFVVDRKVQSTMGAVVTIL